MLARRLDVVLERLGQELADDLCDAEPALGLVARDGATEVREVAAGGGGADVGCVEARLGDEDDMLGRAGREDALGGRDYIVAGLKLVRVLEGGRGDAGGIASPG